MMIVETSDASLDKWRMTRFSIEDAVKQSREGALTVLQKASWDLCDNARHLDIMGETVCFSMCVPLFKQFNEGRSLTAPSAGILMEHHSCLRNTLVARIFDSILMSSEPFLAKHSEKRKHTDCHRFFLYQRYQYESTMTSHTWSR